MSDQRPSVGRIVHYRSYGTPGREYASECRAAIVTGVHWSDDAHGTVWDGSDPTPDPSEPDQAKPEYIASVDLCVLNPTGLFFNEGCEYHEGDPPAGRAIFGPSSLSYRGGTWHWPERV